MTFREWIFQQYVKWQQAEGEPRTVTDFAAHVGVAQPAMRAWMKGMYQPKSAANLVLLADRLGPEVYALLGVPRDVKARIEEQIVSLARAIAELPEPMQGPVRQVVRELAAEGAGAPSEDEIFRRIVKKMGEKAAA